MDIGALLNDAVQRGELTVDQRNTQLAAMTDEAGAVIDRILRNGDSAESHLLLGMTKFEAMQYPDAIADLTKAATLLFWDQRVMMPPGGAAASSRGGRRRGGSNGWRRSE